VVEAVRRLGPRLYVVRGNHDKVAAGLDSGSNFNHTALAAAQWTSERLTSANLRYVRELPEGPIEVAPGLAICHGSPLDEDEYITSTYGAQEALRSTRLHLTFFGHTHMQGGFFANDAAADGFRPEYRTVGQPESVALQLKDSTRYMINPGSVGQPRDGDWRAAFALFDSDAQVVHFHRTPYNLKAAQDRIFNAKLPPRLATRLAAGR